MNLTKRFKILTSLPLAVALLGGWVYGDKSAKTKSTSGGGKSQAVTQTLFDFEGFLDGWRIPDWAFQKADNAAMEVSLSTDQASKGIVSLKMTAKYPPKIWSGAYCEVEREPGNFMDFTGYDTLMADVYLPADAPKKMKGEIILTVGEEWTWTEMRKAIDLTPGTWTTVKADITPESTDWKARFTDEMRSDVRKLGVRVQSNYTEYKGRICIDNIRLATRDKR